MKRTLTTLLCLVGLSTQGVVITNYTDRATVKTDDKFLVSNMADGDLYNVPFSVLSNQLTTSISGPINTNIATTSNALSANITTTSNALYNNGVTLPSNLVTNGQVGLKLVNAALYGGSTNSLGLIVTNLTVIGYPATSYYTNGAILYWPLDTDTNGSRKGLIIKGPLGDYQQIFWPDHGDGGPEMVTEIGGRLAWYYTGIQWGNPSGQSGTEFWWNVPGRSPYIKDGITNYNFTESQNIHFYEAAVWTNSTPIPPITNVLGVVTTNQAWVGPVTYGTGWTRAGSMNNGGLPATHFRATSTNGSGAWVWYDNMYVPTTATLWVDQSLDYNSAIERFRVTVGPDGGATLVGTMNASSFNATNGVFFQQATNAAPAALTINPAKSGTNHTLMNVGGGLIDYWSDGTNVYSKQLAP